MRHNHHRWCVAFVGVFDVLNLRIGCPPLARRSALRENCCEKIAARSKLSCDDSSSGFMTFTTDMAGMTDGRV